MAVRVMSIGVYHPKTLSKKDVQKGANSTTATSGLVAEIEHQEGKRVSQKEEAEE